MCERGYDSVVASVLKKRTRAKRRVGSGMKIGTEPRIRSVQSSRPVIKLRTAQSVGVLWDG